MKAFTLIELLLGMGIFVALVAGVIAIQAFLAQSEAFSLSSVLTTENANAALQTAMAELRSARQSENGSFPLEEATDQQITFYSNADNDEDIERVRYFLDGTELKKGTIDPVGFPATYPSASEVVKIVAEHIQNGTDPVFYYYNEDWPTDTTNNPLSTPAPLSQVTLVKISVRVNADPDRPEGELTLEPFVQIRSLKTNL
ncbi:type II secretion system protein [Patescibacteria group bacterium]|nr:type II secretion system protein [Patescibacteria group bacterium]